MADEKDKGAKVFRTRRSDIISSLSVATALALFGFVRTVVFDVKSIIRDQERACQEAVDRTEKVVREIIELERDSNREILRDLKQRVSWLERRRK